MDTGRLVSNLEREALSSPLDDDIIFGCMAYLSNIIAGTGAARRHRHEENDSNHFV